MVIWRLATLALAVTAVSACARQRRLRVLNGSAGAEPLLPHTGQGAAQAIVDAVALAQVLGGAAALDVLPHVPGDGISSCSSFASQLASAAGASGSHGRVVVGRMAANVDQKGGRLKARDRRG